MNNPAEIAQELLKELSLEFLGPDAQPFSLSDSAREELEGGIRMMIGEGAVFDRELIMTIIVGEGTDIEKLYGRFVGFDKVNSVLDDLI